MSHPVTDSLGVLTHGAQTIAVINPAPRTAMIPPTVRDFLKSAMPSTFHAEAHRIGAPYLRPDTPTRAEAPWSQAIEAGARKSAGDARGRCVELFPGRPGEAVERGRRSRSLRAVLVALAIGLAAYYMTRLPGSPDEASPDSGGRAIIIAVVAGLAVALPWLYWIWSRAPDQDSARQSARLLRDFDSDHGDHDHDRY